MLYNVVHSIVQLKQNKSHTVLVVLYNCKFIPCTYIVYCILLFQQYAAKMFRFQDRIQEPLDIEDVKQKLTTDNYKEKFHKLLCWEEKKHIELLEKRYLGLNTCTCIWPNTQPFFVTGAMVYTDYIQVQKERTKNMYFSVLLKE